MCSDIDLIVRHSESVQARAWLCLLCADEAAAGRLSGFKTKSA
jgi:hypothetical protein